MNRFRAKARSIDHLTASHALHTLNKTGDAGLQVMDNVARICRELQSLRSGKNRPEVPTTFQQNFRSNIKPRRGGDEACGVIENICLCQGIVIGDSEIFADRHESTLSQLDYNPRMWDAGGNRRDFSGAASPTRFS